MASTTRRRRSSYNVVPRRLSPRRVIALVATTAVLIVSVFAVRTVLGLAHLTNQNPLAVIGDLIGGKGGSSINQANADLRRVNFAFYGFGGVGHDGAYLSDSILVVSVQPQSNGPPAVAEVSIPRDWYVPIDLGNGKTNFGRINEAYSDGKDGQGGLPSSDPAAGAAVANRTLGHVLGIHIDHWIGLDFQAFKSAVDAVGGVDVNVPNSFTDYQYPAGECNGQPGANCAYLPALHFDSGPQHMNGSRALQFSRSRHSNDNGEGSDFARSRRQQLIVAALKQRVVSLGGLGNLPDLLNGLGDNVATDLHVNDLEALYGLFKDVDTKSIRHISFDDTNLLYECNYPQECDASYIYAHDRTYGQAAHYLQNIFVDPAAVSEHAKVIVEDGSGRGLGASDRWSSLLSSISLNSSDGGPVHRRPATQIIDESGGKDAATAAWLAKFFGVTVTTPPPPSAVPVGAPTPSAARSGSGGVVVILGQDEENAFLGNPGVGN
ncbi:MAG: LCP family protein [Candidatus Dormibacteraeota bacterium]|uniref:LCP family protein n=1 Tax=Candidatus Amunia macphersoniae TaxID=3127014 RepID=A0A934KRF3_9BACT|nr:LCP family protein [Candidatus Dormibacteraeota bacterium]